MSSTIANLEFRLMRTRVPEPVRRYRLRLRAGYDGTGIVLDSWHTVPFPVTTITLAADAGAAKALKQQYRDLVGRAVAFVDPDGLSYPNTTVLPFREIQHVRRLPGVEGATDTDLYEVRCVWTL